MTKLIAGVVAALILLAWPANAQSVYGVWKTPKTKEGQLHISIGKCGSSVCGTIVSARDSKGRAGSYPHIGRKMIWGMKAKGAKIWSDGKIWDPRRDRTFTSKMELRGNVLEVSGCFLAICQAQSWKRIK